MRRGDRGCWWRDCLNITCIAPCQHHPYLTLTLPELGHLASSTCTQALTHTPTFAESPWVGRFYHRFHESRPTACIKHIWYLNIDPVGRLLLADYCHRLTANQSSGYGPPLGWFALWPTAIVGRIPSADSSGFRISNMFDRDSRPTITESVVDSADSVVESADSSPDSVPYLARISMWVRAFSLCFQNQSIVLYSIVTV